ncbi:flagellar biosynthesis protein FlhG [Nitrosomonas aestuarii]|uniref:Flagellar biosynthesis protein FlhG n=1 Tax=Nitrosomonas aestuarii TaxID=52441 RepID=A0A1I4BSI3_9PROT|nr:AAA family ATPase [Nitrosomonas aestuarii]SFK71340.1 flagellar biosynthesis protein FlhG [Nitrosomonas aestuarii]
MTKFLHNQATGLRDLVSLQTNTSARVITVTGGTKGVGKTTVSVNLASALARSGKRVLLIDENACPNNISSRLGLKARFDLMHVINQDKKLDQVILRGPENIFVLSALRGIHALPKLDVTDQQKLIKCFSQLTESIDVILIDAAMGGETHVLPLSLASEQVLVVVSGSKTSLMGAYALIKMMSKEYAKKHFLIFVNKTDAGLASQTVFEDFSGVARTYLSVSLEFAGFTQRDEKINQASRLCLPVLDAFPISQAGDNFKHLAENVLYSSCKDYFDGAVDGFMQRLIHKSHLSMANYTA